MFGKVTLFLFIIGLFERGSANSKVQVLNGSPYVTLKHGIYFGKTLTGGGGGSNSYHHRDYHAFLGIRYAETPNRMEKSIPMSNLDIPSPMLAMSFGSPCPQISRDGMKIIGKEDCLFGNIYVPAGEPIDKDGFPVIVFIHPGSFTSGSGEDFNVEYFMTMSENVICATFNFRIGALGFLSTSDQEIPDNIGLRDQIVFLEFIRENIEEFGGNKKRITIAGVESGGTSVMHLLLSQNSKGLFQSAIVHGAGSSMYSMFSSQSQASLSSSSIIRKQFSDELECPLRPSYLFAECIKIKRLKDLMLAQKRISGNYLNLSSPFLPGFEKCAGSTTSCLDSFFTKPPALLLAGRQYKRVPLLIGMNSVDTIRADYIRKSSIPFPHEKSGMRESEALSSWLLGILKQIPGFQHQEFITNSYMEIQKLYFNESSQNNMDLMVYNSLKNFLYDIFVVYEVWKFAITYAHDKPVYPYIISFQGNQTNFLFKDDDAGDKDENLVSTEERKIYGAFPDGIEFLTPSLPDYHTFETNSDEDMFSRDLVNLWVTFAVHQKPVDVWQGKETWLPLSASQLNGDKPLTWYSLKSKVIDLIREPFVKRMKFWDRLFKLQN